MRKNIVPLCFCASVLLALDSCTKEQGVTPSSNAEKVATPILEDGRLKFTSLASFHAFLAANQSKTQEQLMQMNRDMGFVSHLRIYHEPGLQPPHTTALLQSKNTSSQAKGASASLAKGVPYADEPLTEVPSNVISPEIADPLLDAALDENSEIAINSLIVRVGNDYTFYYPKGQDALIDDFYAKVATGEIHVTDTDMHAFGNLIVKWNDNVTNPEASASRVIINRSVEDVKYFDDTHRIECQIWQCNYGVYSSSGIKTHATQYGRKWAFFRGWTDFGPDDVGVFATVNYTIPGTAATGPISQSSTGFAVTEHFAAVAVKRFDWATAQIGWSTDPTHSIGAQVQALLLSNMTVTVNNPGYVPPSSYPHPTFNPATLTLQIQRLTSTHTGRSVNNYKSKSLTW